VALAAVAVVAVVAAIAWVAIDAAGGGSAATPPASSSAAYLGPAGVVAPWVLDENRQPGTTAWKIPSSVPYGAIEGFADHTYASDGQTVGFYVTTRARSFRVEAFRMGWYQGTGARLVWSSPLEHGQVQPPCTHTAGINLVECASWHRSFSVALTPAFVQGDYLFKLVAGPRAQAYVPLTIWDPTSHATYLIVARTFTEEGWNAYGGYSYYQGVGPCAPGVPSYPVCNRARVVSFDRPYDTGDGASDFLGDEYPLVRYCEEQGLNVAYVSDVTIDAHPSIVAAHRVLLSLGHDESWSYRERVGLDSAMAHGLNVVFFGAASILRHVRLQPSPLGPDREVVDYRDSQEDPLNGHVSPYEVTGNTWSSPPTSWSAEAQVGEVYSGFLYPGAAAPMVVTDASSWLYRGTGLHDGSALPGVVRSDIDHYVGGVGLPANLEVLAHSPVPLASVYTNQGAWGAVTYSDLTYYTAPGTGSGVLDTGNNNWIDAMGVCPATGGCPASAIALQKMTGNILWLFGQGPAGHRLPARSNLATIRPPGS